MAKIKMGLPCRWASAWLRAFLWAWSRRTGRWAAPVFKFLGDIFIRLIRMVVVPLVFATLVAGAAGISDTTKLGRVATKTLLYYLITTAVSVAVGLLLANIVQPGAGVNLSTDNLHVKPVTPPALNDTLMNLIPINPVEAMSRGNMLQIIILRHYFRLRHQFPG